MILYLCNSIVLQEMNDLLQWRASIGFFKSPVNSVMLMYCEHAAVQVMLFYRTQLSQLYVMYVAMLQMFMHMYVVANCTIVASL